MRTAVGRRIHYCDLKVMAVYLSERCLLLEQVRSTFFWGLRLENLWLNIGCIVLSLLPRCESNWQLVRLNSKPPCLWVPAMYLSEAQMKHCLCNTFLLSFTASFLLSFFCANRHAAFSFQLLSVNGDSREHRAKFTLGGRSSCDQEGVMKLSSPPQQQWRLVVLLQWTGRSHKHPLHPLAPLPSTHPWSTESPTLLSQHTLHGFHSCYAPGC